MAIPPLGADPASAFARLRSEWQRVQRVRIEQGHEQRLELSAGMSGDLEAAVERLDVCACRYRANGTTSSNVTLSSHSSHIFITDTTA